MGGTGPGVELPFGTTSVTAEDISQHIDRVAAIEMLVKTRCPEPAQQFDRYLQELPRILQWLETDGRRFPWRVTTGPWRVYISEILLQRTRASAVADLYPDFFSRFPDALALREATEEEIHALVEPLGFGNQRTRTLTEVAELLVSDHDEQVPADLDALLEPWRVGPYSARATMLFAFGEPHALVDANIARVFERVFSVEMPAQPHKSETVYRLVDALMPDSPGLCRGVTFALLDLGAAICTSAAPSCEICPLAAGCHYAASGEGS